MLPTAISSIEGIYKHRWSVHGCGLRTYLDASTQLTKMTPGYRQNPRHSETPLGNNGNNLRFQQISKKSAGSVEVSALHFFWLLGMYVDSGYLIFSLHWDRHANLFLQVHQLSCIWMHSNQKIWKKDTTPKATQPQKEVDKSWLVLWPGSLANQNATLYVKTVRISAKAPTFSSQETRTRTRLSFPSSGTCTNPGSKEQECIITSCGVETNDAIRNGQKVLWFSPPRKF